MGSPGSEALRITAVWSRQHTGAVGRTAIVARIQQAMRRLGPIEDHVLSTVLEGGAIGPVLRAAAWTGASALQGRPLSLQALLFADSRKNQALAEAIAKSDPDVVYLDGVRTYPLFVALQRRRSVRRIVVDFDDLMSRRMAGFLSSGEVPLGYVGKSLPAWARTLARPEALGRLVLAWERHMLERVERIMTTQSENVVLVSSADAEVLRAGLPEPVRDRVVTIVPCMDIVRPVAPVTAPLRFIFLGSDRQSQNRLTIQYLVSIWDRFRPGAPLVIAGPMVRAWPEVPNVTFTGWLEDTSVLYEPGSIMITPSFIRGGVKTKVLQAFAYGCAAVGNDATFEGMPLTGYPFCFNSDEQLQAFLADLPRQAGALQEAAAFGQRILREHFTCGGFDLAWKRVLSGVN